MPSRLALRHFFSCARARLLWNWQWQELCSLCSIYDLLRTTK
jgi:hypothetical protein